MKYSGMPLEGQYDDSLETGIPLTQTRCDNCDSLMDESEGRLLQVYVPRKGFVTMNCCETCATPVQLNVEQLPGSMLWWIYYVTGLGQKRRVIEAHGRTIPEALENFREKWVEIMDTDLVNFKWR